MLTWRSYTIKKALFSIQRVKLINKKEFAKAVLDESIKTFVVYMALLILKITIYLAKKTHIALLIAKKVTISAEYIDFANIFKKKLAKVLPERIGINKHSIKLVNGKQPSYGLIYSLDLMDFQIFKTYIKTNLANNFIWYPNFPASALILIVCNLNSSF